MADVPKYRPDSQKVGYDSDDDLTMEERKAIKDKEESLNFGGAKKLRQEAWDKAGAFPKLKRSLKGLVYGDKNE